MNRCGVTGIRAATVRERIAVSFSLARRLGRRAFTLARRLRPDRNRNAGRSPANRRHDVGAVAPADLWIVVLVMTVWPFVPYEIHMVSGERYSVPHPDFISISPRGSFVVIIDAKDRPHHLNALLIERASLLNGHRGRKIGKRPR